MRETKNQTDSEYIEVFDTKASSLIAIEVGSVNTRASLFDMVEGRYRFLASGTFPSTVNPPFSDVFEGIDLAVKDLISISGRPLINSKDALIIPSNLNGEGVDNLVSSYSAGKPLKTIVLGLLDNVSLESAVKLALTQNIELVETISIHDQEKTEDQIDKIIHAQPELIIISGGTDNGASKSILKMINILRMAVYLIPESVRPIIFFVGNKELSAQVVNLFSPITKIIVSDNIRPSLDVEDIGVAQSHLTEIFQEIQDLRILGLKELNNLSRGTMVPTSQSLGRVIRFFSNIVRNPKHRGVLGIDLGASKTTIAAAFNDELELRVIPNMGIGSGLKRILETSQLKDITRWIMYDLPSQEVIDYIQNKITQPGTLPATPEDLAIEQALAREIIQQSIKLANFNFPNNKRRVNKDILPNYDPILISGSTLALAPSPAQSLLMVLDSLQPVGIQQIILDKNSLAVALGAAIPINPTLVSQLLLDPVAFLNLGFVVSPDSKAKEGTPVLKIRVEYESGPTKTVTVHQGSIQKIPLGLGQRAKIFLDPLHRANLGMGPGKRLPPHTVVGGALGLIIDARGRPIKFPKFSKDRRVMLKTWLDSLERPD